MGSRTEPPHPTGDDVLTRLFPQRLLGPGLVAVAALLLLIPAALAQAPDGRIQVTGAGTVTTDGKVVMIGWASARKSARIAVRDRAGDAQVTVNGQAQPRQRGTLQVRRNGQFLISGSRVTITVTGDSMNLSIAGNGLVRMRGAGTYSLNGGPAAGWTGNVSLSAGTGGGKSKGKGKARAGR